MENQKDKELIKYLERLENLRHLEVSEWASFVKMFDWEDRYSKRINAIVRKYEKEFKKLQKEFKDIL